MKILILATIYEYGGLSGVMHNITNNLDRNRFNIIFLTERLSENHYPLEKDIKLINMDIRSVRGVFGKICNIFSHLSRMRRAIMCEKPDVVIGFGFAVNCHYLLSFLWPSRFRPKVVLGEFTEQLFVKEKMETFSEKVINSIYKTIMFFLYHKADVVISVSESLRRHIRRFFLMDKKKIKIIRVPVNTERIRLLSRECIYGNGLKDNIPCVGTLSRLSEEKGINYLIEGFSDLVKKLDAQLVIVGEGREKKKLERMTRDFNIRDRVFFLGWQENPYKYLKRMDVFILPSLWEGFPTAVIESMVCGVPVIATRSTGGVEELIEDGVNGLLVPVRDTKSLSDSVYTLLQNKELRGRFVKKAEKKAEEFDTNRIVKQYESVILALRS
jgi:glycosyltransferase involved in cell wall biosynthesis